MTVLVLDFLCDKGRECLSPSEWYVYKAMVQAVVLFVGDTWNLVHLALKRLEGLHL